MPYHVVAYQANTFGVTNFDSTPVTDFLIATQNGHLFPHIGLNFYGGWFGGANLTKVTFTSPKARMIVPPVLYPIDAAATPPSRPHMFDRRGNPYGINPVEEAQILMNIGGTASGVCTAVMFWGTSLDPVPAGETYTIHGTSATTAVANQWTTTVPIWDQTIPAGVYSVISTQHQSATGIAHRVFFKDQILRPGFLSINALSNMNDPSYYQGGWGMLGAFNTTAYPTWEVLCGAADAAHDFTMTFIRTG